VSDSRLPSCPTGTCSQLGRISTLEAHHSNVAQSLLKLEGKIDQVLMHLGKIEVLEQKHISNDQALSRAFGEIHSIKEDMSNLYKGMEAGIKETVHVFSRDLKDAETRLSASIKQIEEKAAQTDKNFEALMNRLRGAAWAMAVAWAVFGGAVVYLLVKAVG